MDAGRSRIHSPHIMTPLDEVQDPIPTRDSDKSSQVNLAEPVKPPIDFSVIGSDDTEHL